MDHEQLQALVILAQTKNFTRAAEISHVTQSTMTARIKALEKQVGKPLFKRNNRRVELTTAGGKAVSYAKRIVDLMDECETSIRLEEDYKDRIVIGSVHSLWDYSLVPIVEQFREEYPETAVRLITGHSFEVVQNLLDGTVDVGVVYIPPKSPEIESVLLYSDPIQLVAHPEFPLETDMVTAEVLLKLPLVFLDWGPPFTDWFRKEIGSQYTPGLEVDHATMMMQFLLDGKGVGFVTDSVARSFLESGQLKMLSYQAKFTTPKRDVHAVYLKKNHQSSVIRRWMALMEEWETN